jgi:hypothetical protein
MQWQIVQYVGEEERVVVGPTHDLSYLEATADRMIENGDLVSVVRAENVPAQGMDLVDRLTRWDEGELTWEEFVETAQYLVDNAMAWTLQGSIGRTCVDLIESGYVTPPNQREED